MRSKKQRWIGVVFYVLLIALSLCIIWSVLSYSDNLDDKYGLDNPNKLAGVLGGVFSMLAFIGVLVTLHLQKKSYYEQKKTAALERFESTFFNMLSQLQEIVRDLVYAVRVPVETKTEKEAPNFVRKTTRYEYRTLATGRDVFKYLYELNVESYSVNSYKKKAIFGMKGVIEVHGLSEYIKHDSPTYFDHYFRFLYRILKFVDDSDSSFLTDTNKYNYIGMLRGMLSKYELAWIYYNGLSDYGKNKLKPLIEKYALLKNLREDILANSKEYTDYISEYGCSSKGFPENEYEFFQTINSGDPNKYYIGAFWYGKELEIKVGEFGEREIVDD